MNNNLTELVFILDRSGSMSGRESDTIGGFNNMIAKQKAEDGEAYVSTVLFDHEFKVLHDRVKLQDIAPLTEKDYEPRGSTALVDAIGRSIHHIGCIHKYARAEDVPAKTVFVIITDGAENASCEYSVKEVREMIDREEKQYDWSFLFLGANLDAIRSARDLGIREEDSAMFDVLCIEEDMECVSNAVSNLRFHRSNEGWQENISANRRRKR